MVVRRASTATRPKEVVVYSTEERVGEESLQRFIVEMLRPLIASYLASKGIIAFTQPISSSTTSVATRSRASHRT